MWDLKFMYTTNDIFSSSYVIRQQNISCDLNSLTVKEALQNISNAALFNCWFDGEENFYFKNKLQTKKDFIIKTTGTRAYDQILSEIPLENTINIDIEKIKNYIELTGTSDTNVYIDAISIEKYGTRKLTYKNEIIPTLADLDNYGTILLNYLKDKKYVINTKILLHPEIEILDNFDLFDLNNNKILQNVYVKKHILDLKNWLSEISGEAL